MKKRIALDSMIFIYHFEESRAYFHEVQKILLSAQEGEYELVTSTISVIEALSTPKYLRLHETVNEIKLFFKEAGFIKVIDVSWDIAIEAASLRRQHESLRTPDAIQLATAIVSGADVFITNDVRLSKIKTKLKGIKIVGLK